MIDIVEVASINVLVRVPAPTLNQHDNPGSIDIASYECWWYKLVASVHWHRKVYTQCKYKVNDEIRSEIYINPSFLSCC